MVRTFLRAIEDGDRDALTRVLDPQVRRTEHPNRVAPAGRTQGLAEMLDGFEKGRALIARQSYEVASAVASGGRVAVQMTWRGTLAIALGALKAGEEMVAHCALFATVRDGRIVSIDNYDCFAPF
ncbi:hypothetical protein VE25_01935 [Devosia geojensis]|uniref:SnoaL-like domain-containing protein n=1 Tax=Devosia geojensis TaxID=443610 RepID=A0A0F5FZ15_9HYPH|nr:hypothetical protein VE25_01935 [Devosia geojensis]